ncbi:MAG: proline--tRNA ligase, partial [Bacilli bacterium]
MKLSQSFFYTIREDIKNEESISGKLLVKSGMVKKEGTGTYMYMPMGLKVLKNIENIIRDEMNKTGAQEVLMPSLISEEIYIS